MDIDNSILILSSEEHKSETSTEEILRRSQSGDVYVFIARNMKQVVELDVIAKRARNQRIDVALGFIDIADREGLVIDRVSYTSLNVEPSHRVVIMTMRTVEEAARAKVLKSAVMACKK